MFGTAGIPSPAKGLGPVAGLETLSELGLDAMELEFVRGVWMSEDSARAVATRARTLGIYLTAHAPYWLNLNSPDKRVVRASIERIVRSAEVADLAGARHLAFHAAFYSGSTAARTYVTVRRRLKRLVRRLSSRGLSVTLSPEVMGRVSQFGSIEEIVDLCSDVEGLTPCVDFSHLHARTGRHNSYEEYCDLLDMLRARLGGRAISRMHVHVSGIDYGPKGEIRHLSLRGSDLNYRALLKALKSRRAGGIVICESPDPVRDAAILKRAYYRIRP
jgi:deoxyribonuclease-4